MEYYIVSLPRKSDPDEECDACGRGASRGPLADLVLFWRPNNSGYTVFLEAAGRYSQEDVENNQSYYNDGERTIAVPCARVDGYAKLVVYIDHLRALKDGTPNPEPRSRIPANTGTAITTEIMALAGMLDTNTGEVLLGLAVTQLDFQGAPRESIHDMVDLLLDTPMEEAIKEAERCDAARPKPS